LSHVRYITHPITIRRILSKLNLPTETPQFSPDRDPPQYDFNQLLDTEDGFCSDIEPVIEYTEEVPDFDICQLVPGTEDGFYE